MKKISVLALALALAIGVLAGCSSSSASSSAASADASASSASSASASAESASASAESASASAASVDASAAAEDPTPDNPIVVDKEKGEIRYMGYVDGVYFTENTRHGVVYEAGSNGHKTIISGYGDEKEFYQACIDMGWTPGNNLTKDNMAGGDAAASVEGDKLDVTIRWDGQDEIPFGDIYEATNGETWTPDYRFGGNLASAEKNNTGCVLCLDSCATGIASDAYWPTGTTNPDNVTWFHGKEDVLPADGTNVIVIFRKAA